MRQCQWPMVCAHQDVEGTNIPFSTILLHRETEMDLCKTYNDFIRQFKKKTVSSLWYFLLFVSLDMAYAATCTLWHITVMTVYLIQGLEDECSQV